MPGADVATGPIVPSDAGVIPCAKVPPVGAKVPLVVANVPPVVAKVPPVVAKVPPVGAKVPPVVAIVPPNAMVALGAKVTPGGKVAPCELLVVGV